MPCLAAELTALTTVLAVDTLSTAPDTLTLTVVPDEPDDLDGKLTPEALPGKSILTCDWLAANLFPKSIKYVNGANRSDIKLVSFVKPLII